MSAPNWFDAVADETPSKRKADLALSLVLLLFGWLVGVATGACLASILEVLGLR